MASQIIKLFVLNYKTISLLKSVEDSVRNRRRTMLTLGLKLTSIDVFFEAKLQVHLFWCLTQTNFFLNHYYSQDIDQ